MIVPMQTLLLVEKEQGKQQLQKQKQKTQIER